jgi:hypothetical protein
VRRKSLQPHASERLTSSSDRLSVLLLDYEMAREDDRTLFNVQAGALSIAVTLIGALAALISQTCQFQPQNPSCAKVPDALLAGAPLIPMAVISFLAVVGATATIRSYYARALESEIRQELPMSLTAIPGVAPASYLDLTIGLVSLRRGGVGHRLLNWLLLVTVVLVFGGLAVLIGVHIDAPVLRWLMLVGYGLLGVLLVTETLNVSIFGRHRFVRIASEYLVRSRLSDNFPTFAPAPENPERRMVSYLLLPRPEDLIKWLFFPVAFLFAVLSAGRELSGVARNAVVVFVVLEYLLYEARYQLNDVRGFVEDGRHPDRRSRGRLPHGSSVAESRRNVLLSLLVMVLRIVAAFALSALVDVRLLPVTVVLFVLVFGIAAVYEWLRRGSDAAGRGRTLAIWTVVGAGYGLRGTVGLFVGGITATGVLTVAALAFSAFGVAFVTFTWVLEAASHHVGSIPGPVSPAAGRETDKRHLTALLPYVHAVLHAAPSATQTGGGATATPPAAVAEETLRGCAALRARGRLGAPWNWATVVCMAGGAALGAACSSPAGSPGLPLLVPAVAGAVLGCALCLARGTKERIAAVIIGLPTLFLADGSAGGAGITAVVPVAVFAVYLTWFRTLSYADLKEGLKPLVRLVKRVLHATLYRVTGPATFAAVHWDRES